MAFYRNPHQAKHKRKKYMGNIYLMKMPHNIKKLGISMLLSILNFIYFKKLKCILQWVFCSFIFLKLFKICWGQHFKYVLLACKYIYYMYLIHCLPYEYESGLPIIVLSIINVCVFYHLMEKVAFIIGTSVLLLYIFVFILSVFIVLCYMFYMVLSLGFTRSYILDYL